MPATPKDRTGRPQKYNNIGEVGRITGVEPPRNVPRDSGDYERAEDFFDSTERSSEPEEEAPVSAGKGKKRDEGEGAGARGRARPDRYASDFGERGRKTGVRVAPVERDANGFEGVSNFFASSPASAPATTPRAVAKQSARNPLSSAVRVPNGLGKYGGGAVEQVEELDQNVDYGGGGDDDEEEAGQTQDMDVDDGSSMTPNAYVRAQAQSGSKATGNTRRLSDISQSSSDDDLNPDTLTLASVPRNKVVASAKKSSLSMLGSPGKGRKAVIADSEEEEDDVIIVQTDDEEEAPVPKTKNRPSGPRVSNVSAGTNGTGSRRSSLGTPISAKAAKALSSKKGKGRAVEEEEEEQSYVYNDEGQEYSEEEQQPAYDDEEEVVPVPRKLLKNGKEPAPKTKVRAPVPAKRARHNDSSDEENADGVRRSRRQRVTPLDYWRNERVIYKRRPSGLGVDAVVRIPKPTADPLSKLGKKSGGPRIKREVKEEWVHEEDGVDDMTDPDGTVWSWEGNAETTRRIAFTAKMIDPRPTYNNKFMFQKIFTELDYLAGGILLIPAGCEKPQKPAKDNSYMFYCIEGAVSVIVHRTRFAIGPGACFFVPRGNSYSITATSNRDVKLFFTQGRRILETPTGETYPDEQQPVEEEPEEEEDEEEEEEEEGAGEEADPTEEYA